MHERLRPKHHRFTYPVFYVRCDLARLASLDSWWFGIDRWRPLACIRATTVRVTAAISTHGCARNYPSPALKQRTAGSGCKPSRVCSAMRSIRSVSGFATIATANCARCWPKCATPSAIATAICSARPTTRRSQRKHGLTCRKVLHVSPFCRVEGGYTFRVREAPNRASVSIDYTTLTVC